MAVTSIANNRANIDHYEERVDMPAPLVGR